MVFTLFAQRFITADGAVLLFALTCIAIVAMALSARLHARIQTVQTRRGQHTLHLLHMHRAAIVAWLAQ